MPSAILKILFLVTLTTSLLACSSTPTPPKDGPPKFYENITQIHNPKPHYLPKSAYGNPKHYTVNGKTYHVLRTAKGYDQRGIASWYGSKFTGKLTSTRERYNPYKMTAASPNLPIPCFVRVTNLENHRSVIVKVNDRGPFAPNRILDLSYAAAVKLGYARRGTALVEVSTINPRNSTRTPHLTFNKKPHLYLQLGAFRHYQSAKRLQKRLQSLVFDPVQINQGTANAQSWYRVQIGPLRNVAQSDRLQKQLAQRGLGRPITVIR